MTVTIHDTTMTSGQPHAARQAPGGGHGWEVPWLPGQVLDPNAAITVMTLADTIGECDLHESHRLWPHIQARAANSAGPPPTRSRAFEPPDKTSKQEPATSRADPERALRGCRWRAVNAPHLVALVRAGATFINGKLVERPGENAEQEAA